jgi:hypothetical protein
MNTTQLTTNRGLTAILRSFFAQFKVIVGTPKMTFKGNKVIVHIPYFDLSTTQLYETKVNALGTAIIEYLNNETSVVELRLIQLQYPYLDSTILGQYLALNASKYNFLRMKKKLFTLRVTSRSPRRGDPGKASQRTKSHSICRKLNCTQFNTAKPHLPTRLTGVKVELAGRLTTQRSIPRKTVSNAYKGSFTVDNKLNSSLNISQYTSKNKLGAYTMKV